MNYPVAKLEEYGYKDHRKAQLVWKIISKIIVIFIVVMLYISTIMIAIQSFNSSSDITQFKSFTFKWYLEIIQNRSLFTAIKNTLFVSIIATILSTIVGTLVAVGIYSLPKKEKHRAIFYNNIPLLNADIITGISLMLVFSMLLPVFTYLFGAVTLILAHIFFAIPYVVLSVLPKLKEVDGNLMDAALDLGIKPMRALKKVLVPAIRSGIFAGALLAFTMSIDDFVISYYTTGNGFSNLSIWIYASIGRKSLTPAVYAFSTLMTLTTLTILVLYQLSHAKKRGKKHV